MRGGMASNSSQGHNVQSPSRPPPRDESPDPPMGRSGCCTGFLCLGSLKRGKRIVPATRMHDASNTSPRPWASNGAPQSNPANQYASLSPSLLAPPSSPASFQNSAVQSSAQSPCAYPAVSGPSATTQIPLETAQTMFQMGPYAHETALVSPPVFSNFTTAPSTAPFTPPPELATHLTTPSSPDVPFAQLLANSFGSKQAVRLQPAPTYSASPFASPDIFAADDLQAAYQLYPGSPLAHLLSPASGTGTVTPLPDLEPSTPFTPFQDLENPVQVVASMFLPGSPFLQADFPSKMELEVVNSCSFQDIGEGEQQLSASISSFLACGEDPAGPKLAGYTEQLIFEVNDGSEECQATKAVELIGSAPGTEPIIRVSSGGTSPVTLPSTVTRLSSDGESPVTCVSNGRTSPGARLSSGGASPVTLVSNGRASPVTRLSSGGASPVTHVSHGLAAPNTLVSSGGASPVTHVSNGRTSPITIISSGGASPVTHVSNGRTSPITLISSGGASPVSHISNGRTSPITRISSGGASPVTHISNGRTLPVTQMSGGGASPVPHVSNGRTSPITLISSGGASPVTHVSNGRTSPITLISSGGASPVTHVSNGRTSLFTHMSSGGASPVTHVSNGRTSPVTRLPSGGTSPVTLVSNGRTSPVTRLSSGGTSPVTRVSNGRTSNDRTPPVTRLSSGGTSPVTRLSNGGTCNDYVRLQHLTVAASEGYFDISSAHKFTFTSQKFEAKASCIKDTLQDSNGRRKPESERGMLKVLLQHTMETPVGLDVIYREQQLNVPVK